MKPSFAEFEASTKAQGYQEVLERHWAPDTVVNEHTHPFDASALVVEGELWLTVGERTQHLLPGGRFELARNTPHSERYGAQGATFWVGRRGAAIG